MAFNPFSNDTEDTSFEQGSPITQATKATAKATSAQADAQVKATNKAIVDQLYGPSSPSETPDSADTTHMTGQQSSSASSPTSPDAQNPDEQGKLDETRRKLQDLQRLHRRNYFEANFGEEAQKKRAQDEQQQRQAKEQEEEEKAQQEAEQKRQWDEEMMEFAHQSKQLGRNKMREPVALSRAKTKTEINRGTVG